MSSQEMLDGIIDKFAGSETLLLAIKTPSREVIEGIVGAAMNVREISGVDLNVIGVFFDCVPVRENDMKSITEAFAALDSMRESVNLDMPIDSLQIA